MRRYIMKIGIASEDEIKQRTLDIVAGRRRRERGEPRVWFTSMRYEYDREGWKKEERIQ